MTTASRPKPVPTPETRHFWDGTREHRLVLQQCEACSHTYFPPRPFCPKCSGRSVRLVQASGRGKLYSYVIGQRPAPGFEPPYSIAVVELDEGPRMMSNIVECPQTPEALVLDMPLEVTWQALDDDITLPMFRPVAAKEAQA